MVKEGGLPFKMDRSRPSRIGLVRKPSGGVYKWPEAAAVAAAGDGEEGRSGVERWFEVDPFFCFHTANSWEEDCGSTVWRRTLLVRDGVQHLAKQHSASCHHHVGRHATIS
jgi:Retinal pigment epithelial membrane protein